ncbi:flagellar operon protein (TIGR03826 family) [Lysinibacillus composti]|uniref:Flagellar protein n=1 Tax=Lysinibacillus composti TaxID=720633 RepID=A0A3N9UJ28_9BACI|nr:TIGR03826 family flagellar region protein [Lysinibacillus composti]MBM7607977.1 flagellar operon protein (TIGR03826 family) [Lysinibacillus composti]RQW75438.1 hypothetical protein EBB45_06745 [Lysinibacillus composti]
MAEIRNCPSCGELFNYIGIRDICNKCARNEEELYEVVYRFLRKRENRAATVERIVEATGVKEELLYKWVKKKRLHPAMFPNLGYPCDNCGRLTNNGKLCDRCKGELTADLRSFEATQEFKDKVTENERATYLAGKRSR